MKHRLLALLLAACTLLCLVLTSCSKSTDSNQNNSTDAATQDTQQEDANGNYKDTVVWAQSADVTSMDPHIGKETAAVTVTCNIFSTLLEVIGDGDPQPLLAESYQQLNDKDWEFTIRQGVKFHDGSDLTVEDVKWSLDRAIASNYVNYIVSFIESVEITGENTIVIHCAEPYAPILNNLSMPFSAIVPKAYIEANGDEYFSQHPIGSGPYKMVEWNPSDSVKLEAFDEYFMGKPASKNLVMKVIPEAAQRVIALEMGEVDIAYSIEANDVDKIDANPDLVKYAQPSMTCFNYFFNLVDADRPTYDLKVRQAICYAIDRQKIIDTILHGSATLADSMIAPIVACYTPTPTYDYDLEKAKSLLAEAGYPDGIDLEITIPSNYEVHMQTGEVVAEQLKAAGINATINPVEWNTWLEDVYTGRKYQATISGIACDLTPGYMINRFQTDAKKYFINFSDEEYDKVWAEAQTTIDPEQKKEQYAKLQEILCDQAGSAFIQVPANITAISKRLAGYKFYPVYVQDMSTVYITE